MISFRLKHAHICIDNYLESNTMKLWVVEIRDYICFSVFSKFQQCMCNTASVIILQVTKGSFKSKISIYDVPTIGETHRDLLLFSPRPPSFFS